MAYTQIKAEQVEWADGATSTTTNQASKIYNVWGTQISVTAKVTGTGAVTGDVAVQVTNIPAPTEDDWITSTTIALTDTDVDVDGAAISAAWAYYRLTLTNLTGTGATCTAWIAGTGA